jgi:hypothetical protein
MSFIKGFLFGTAVGIAIGGAISEAQRREFIARVVAPTRRRVEPLAGAVTEPIGQRVATVASA